MSVLKISNRINENIYLPQSIEIDSKNIVSNLFMTSSEDFSTLFLGDEQNLDGVLEAYLDGSSSEGKFSAKDATYLLDRTSDYNEEVIVSESKNEAFSLEITEIEVSEFAPIEITFPENSIFQNSTPMVIAEPTEGFSELYSSFDPASFESLFDVNAKGEEPEARDLDQLSITPSPEFVDYLYPSKGDPVFNVVETDTNQIFVFDQFGDDVVISDFDGGQDVLNLEYFTDNSSLLSIWVDDEGFGRATYSATQLDFGRVDINAEQIGDDVAIQVSALSNEMLPGFDTIGKMGAYSYDMTILLEDINIAEIELSDFIY